jgi:hypothetical protein
MDLILKVLLNMAGMPLEESVENPEKKQKKWTGSQTREFSGKHCSNPHHSSFAHFPEPDRNRN